MKSEITAETEWSIDDKSEVKTVEDRVVFVDGVRSKQIAESEALRIKEYFVTEDGVYAFTSQDELERWLLKQPAIRRAREVTDHGIAKLKAYAGGLLPAQREALLEEFATVVRQERAAISERLKHSQTMMKFVTDTMARRMELKSVGLGAPGGAYCFRHCSYNGYYIYFPEMSPTTVPSLYLLGMNDAISSVQMVRHGTSFQLNLFEHSGYRGRRISINSGAADTVIGVKCLKGSPYYFNDKASSAWCSPFWEG
jgi:hypothetical protein